MIKTGRWVIVPGMSDSLSSSPPVTVISGSVFSSHSLGSRLVAYKLHSFHPSYFIPVSAQSFFAPLPFIFYPTPSPTDEFRDDSTDSRY